MRTPIADFVNNYANKRGSRFHMPGHKGQAFLGCEALDITEITGADALYEADGIIEESEKNATGLFGTAKTIYSTEGSSQCIRAMVHLLTGYWNVEKNIRQVRLDEKNEITEVRPYILAARNVHKAFLYAAALVDIEIVWLYSEETDSVCSCEITSVQLEAELKKTVEKHYGVAPAAVYVTSPDYLGRKLQLRELAEVCHKNDTLLAVDNAHGAYLHFLKEPMHPMDLGADICCDSAHKTLPVLTGGAYLQISKKAPAYLGENAKQAMALFGSTSPSYLTMTSLDLCNSYLANDYREKLEKTIVRIGKLRERLTHTGWKVKETDPLKVTIFTSENGTGMEVAEYLRQNGVECEYADEEFVVFMITPENEEEDYINLQCAMEKFKTSHRQSKKSRKLPQIRCEQKCSVREAIFSRQEMVNAKDAVGRICGVPTVGCPPAIPIVVAGEVINEEAVRVFEYYGIKNVSVVV